MAVELGKFTHSEEERAAMDYHISMSTINKTEMSARELRDLVYMIYERDEIEEDLRLGQYDRDLPLPDENKPEILFRPGLPEDNFFDIVILDGLDVEHDSGEYVRLTADDRGRLRWKIGIAGSVHSEALGRRVLLDPSEIVFSKSPITPIEHLAVAQKVVTAWVMGPGKPNSLRQLDTPR